MHGVDRWIDGLTDANASVLCLAMLKHMHK